MINFSAITAIYNHVEYLEQCILSILGQSTGSAEHLLTDGGSVDGSRELLKHYEELYPDKIRCFYNDTDIGVIAQVNNMIKAARGKTIGFLPADDKYLYDTAEIVNQHFLEHPKSMCLYGSCHYISYRTNQPWSTIFAKPFDLNKLINGRLYVYGASMFYRREVFDDVGMLLPIKDEEAVCDLDLLIRIGKKYGLDYTRHALSYFRMRSWELSGKSWERTKAVLKASHLVTKKYGAKRFSWSARAYFLAKVIDFVRPVFGFMYPTVDKIIEKTRLS
jgi:glycosyltransferase involved in cell wall biosynthesis